MRVRPLLTALTAAVLLFGVDVAVPRADAASITTATITIQGGVLAISVPTGTVNLGTVVNTVGGETVSSPLGPVVVGDARSATGGWVASVISSAFTPPAGPTVAASFIGYKAGTITKVGIATYVVTDQANLTGIVPVVTATAVGGDNSATWNPTITVAVAQGTLAGVYQAIITHSVV